MLLLKVIENAPDTVAQAIRQSAGLSHKE